MKGYYLVKLFARSGDKKKAAVDRLRGGAVRVSKNPVTDQWVLTEGSEELAKFERASELGDAVLNTITNGALVAANPLYHGESVSEPSELDGIDPTMWAVSLCADSGIQHLLVMLEDTGSSAVETGVVFDGIRIEGFSDAEAAFVVDRLKWLAANCPAAMSGDERHMVEEAVVSRLRMIKDDGREIGAFKPRFIDAQKKYVWSAVTMMTCGFHVLFEGEKATGKNVLSGDLAELFALPMKRIEMPQKSREDLEVSAEISGGTSRYELSDFLTAARDGSLVVLDELNMVKSADNLAFLNSILEEDGEVQVAHYGLLQKHPATMFVGTMNPAGPGYAGTRELNDATKSRFTIIEVAYDTGTAATVLRAKLPQLSTRAAADLGAFYESVRALVVDGTLPEDCLSMRQLIACATLVARGARKSPKQAITEFYPAQCPAEFRDQVRSVIDSMPD